MPAQKQPTPASIVLGRSIVDFMVTFSYVMWLWWVPGNVRALAPFLSGAHYFHYWIGGGSEVTSCSGPATLLFFGTRIVSIDCEAERGGLSFANTTPAGKREGRASFPDTVTIFPSWTLKNSELSELMLNISSSMGIFVGRLGGWGSANEGCWEISYFQACTKCQHTLDLQNIGTCIVVLHYYSDIPYG